VVKKLILFNGFKTPPNPLLIKEGITVLNLMAVERRVHERSVMHLRMLIIACSCQKVLQTPSGSFGTDQFMIEA
jgi:hypothetical protein